MPTPSSGSRIPSRDKVRAHRAAMRALGFRPLQIWVPDTRSPAFTAEAARQSRGVALTPESADADAFIASVFDWPDEETAAGCAA